MSHLELRELVKQLYENRNLEGNMMMVMMMMTKLHLYINYTSCHYWSERYLGSQTEAQPPLGLEYG